ncbi:AAA family ATPase [Candidatus Woesearchaeota archaeon]|nr:AAA family ATPase [Candidatus Woesearchaeota archaeon]
MEEQASNMPEMPQIAVAAVALKATRINKMVMQGFKSFAKHTEILFGGNFNCVLGPNGAGKSNVLDALCFVLGKSSSRDLRAEKSANLIYNGGKAKKQAKQGEVSIYFDNTHKVFPTDDKEVKISRIVRQNGQSIYKINDRVMTRQQVTNLLSLAKIDPDGYNIILQGDIVKFVEMHPEDRRVLIEDIAGISVYEERKHKAMLELENKDPDRQKRK